MRITKALSVLLALLMISAETSKAAALIRLMKPLSSEQWRPGCAWGLPLWRLQEALIM